MLLLVTFIEFLHFVDLAIDQFAVVSQVAHLLLPVCSQGTDALQLFVDLLTHPVHLRNLTFYADYAFLQGADV